jgi:hypothetical protein
LCALERWAPGADESGEPARQTPIEKPEPGAPPTFSGARIRIPAKAGIEELIPGYLDNCRKNILMLAEAVAKADFEAARVIGHGMKGCGLGYGFAAITDFGKIIEQSAAENDTTGVSVQIARLEDFLSRLDVTHPF